MNNKLIVKSDNRLEEVSAYFSKEYPYLKLEFFKKPHEDFAGNPLKDKLEPGLTISDCNGKSGEVNIEGSMAVSDLEKEIKEQLNLNVQVFRKSGKVWLETTATDSWSLDEQNSRGEEAFN